MRCHCASGLGMPKIKGGKKTRKERFHGEVSLLGQGKTLDFQRFEQQQACMPRPFLGLFSIETSTKQPNCKAEVL